MKQANLLLLVQHVLSVQSDNVLFLSKYILGLENKKNTEAQRYWTKIIRKIY